MKETIETFIRQHKVFITDPAFIAVFLLSVIAVMVLICFLVFIFVSIRKLSKGTLYLYDRMKKRGHLYDDTESTDIPDIPDSDTGGGTPELYEKD